MGTNEVRNREVRRDMMMAAAARWSERTRMREQALLEVSRKGPGAGDPPEHRLRWNAREHMKFRRILSATERIVGITNDLVPLAPDELAFSSAKPVARIAELPAAGRLPRGLATGFVIPGNLLLTNYHVFQQRSDVRGVCANFEHYEDEQGLHVGSYVEFDPDRFFISDEELDFAIVALKTTGMAGERLADHGHIRLIEATGKVVTGQPLNIVQHPGGGPRRYATTNNRLLDILSNGFLHYETDTLQGSSGSPVSSPGWELVGLHHCGIPRMENGNIMTRKNTVWNPRVDHDDDIHWVANECSRISFIVDRLRSMRATSASEQAILAELLATTGDPLTVPASPMPEAKQGYQLDLHAAATTGTLFSFSGPVTINVNAAPAPAAASRGVIPAFPEKALVFDPAYAARTGYDPAFLGIPVPLPSVDPARAGELYCAKDYEIHAKTFRDVPAVDLDGADGGTPVTLHYHHYSLAFNKKFRMCHWTASNVDYSELQRQDRRARAEFGGESWRYDPRVPRELQLGDRDIYKPATRVDRGHIVRREDNCWGAPGPDTEFANADTYHWTNCTPQHEAFNQENPKDNDNKGASIYAGLGLKGTWGHFEADLEETLADNGGQASIFAGPVLSSQLSVSDWGKGQVAIPNQFWKVIVVPDSRAARPVLKAYGYLFDQEPAVKRFGLRAEQIELPDFKKHRASLAEISELTGMVFDKVILDAEQA